MSDKDSEENDDIFGVNAQFKSDLKQTLDRFHTKDRLDRSLLHGILIKSKEKAIG